MTTIIAKGIYIVLVALLAFWYIQSPDTCPLQFDWILRAVGIPGLIIVIRGIIRGQINIKWQKSFFSEQPLAFSVVAGLQLFMCLVLCLGINFLLKYHKYALFSLAAIPFLSLLAYFTARTGYKANIMQHPSLEERIHHKQKGISKSDALVIFCFVFGVLGVRLGWFNRGEDSVMASFREAKHYEIHSQYNDAIHELDKVIQIEPRNSKAYFHRGNDYSKLGQYQMAITDFTKTIELAPNHVQAYTNRAKAYIELKQYQLAIDDLSKAIELDPSSVAAYNIRGQAYQQLGQREAAKEDLLQAQKLGYKPPS